MSSPNGKEWNSVTSVQAEIKIQGDLNIDKISKEIDEINIQSRSSNRL
ncbi:MAG: hypothetical protein WC046_02060 [Candidatus Bathyarchaeia archaeon]|jgi:hypothetical protein